MHGPLDLDRDFATFCRTADPEALGRVFDATAGHLLRIAAWLCGNRADAEDAVQRAFLVAIEQRASFRRGKPALPWLVGLLTNQVHKVRRERARRAPPIKGPAAEPDPVVRAAGAELEQALGSVVQSLGPAYHDVLHLHLREGLAAHEIAQRLGRPAGTVRTQIVRGVHELRRRLPTGFAGGIAPAWLAVGPLAPVTAVRDTVLAAAKAQHALLATAATTARTGTLLAALAATLAVGVGLYWFWPGRDTIDPAQHTAAARGGDARGAARDRGEPRDEGVAAITGSAAENAAVEPPLAREVVGAAPPPAAADAALQVRVRDGLMQPLAGVRVWLCDSRWRPEDAKLRDAIVLARTADDGVATFAAPDARLDTVVVHANGRRPVQAARGASSGMQDVAVDQQLSITGLVVVDGGRPGEPIELVAYAGQQGGTWCDAARAALSPFDPNETSASAVADASGRFAFFGLEPQTEHSIYPLERVFKRPGTERTSPGVKATPLAVDVVLELARVPLIRGRSVLPDDVPSDGREQVWINPRFVNSNGWSEWGAAMCRPGEPFTIAVFDTNAIRTELEFRFGRAKGSPVVAMRSVTCPFEGVHDLGDVVLDDPRAEREVRITARDGTPIAGARVISAGLLSAPTGADGCVGVVVVPPPAKIVAGARGFRVRSIDVADEPPQPLHVVLEPANRLRIEASAAGAQRLAPLWVSLVYVDLPKDHDFGDRKAVSELRGAKLVMTRVSGDEVEYVFEMPATGELELFDVQPTLEFTLKLCDGFGHPIEARRVTMGAGERRDERFVVALPPRRLAGQVVDAEGRPLSGADVHVGDSFDTLRTDVDGRFHVEGVYGDAPSLRFDKDGFRQLSVTGAELLERTTFRLEREN